MERGLINIKQRGKPRAQKCSRKKFILLAIQKFQVDQTQSQMQCLAAGNNSKGKIQDREQT